MKDIMSEDKKSMDDEQGNCKQCGHPFDPHLVIAFDTNDFSKGGMMKCNIENCECSSDLTFNFDSE